MSRMGTGQPNSKIMIVGENFTEAEEFQGEAFLGMSGERLNRMLHDVGIMRSECYTTNLCNRYPPHGDINNWIAHKQKDITASHTMWKGKYVLQPIMEGYERLMREIELVKPNIIIACGNAAAWALTGAWGVMKWHGSQLNIDGDQSKTKVIPTYHPTQIQWAFDLRAVMVNDLRRAARESQTQTYTNIPEWNFRIRPSFLLAKSSLESLLAQLNLGPLWITFDLETRAGHIACAGFSWTLQDAISIPFMCVESIDGYWEVAEEAVLVHLIYQILTHTNAKVRGQNLLYDAQYTYRHWHFVPRVAQDTMISHHTMWAGLPKRLDFQASMYCDHYVYWKDDGKTWTKDVGEDQLWSYNCIDCVRTDEVGIHELGAIKQMGLQQVEDFQQALFWPVLKAMQIGVRIDKKGRNLFAMELQEEMEAREALFNKILGHPLNPRSSVQMAKLFYNDLGIPPIMSRAKKGAPAHITCDDEALVKIMKKEPITIPLIRAIQEYRSLGVFLSTFVLAPLDKDDRMRCSYNICGTETYRFSSSANAFGSGTNLQNIPSGSEEDGLVLPNVRKLFIPDEGYTFFDMDLDRADMQVVVWESGEPALKEALRKGVDMHILNAITLAGKELPDLDWLCEGHAEYPRIRSLYKRERQLAKSFIHGCVTAGHEILTPKGWVNVEDYQDGTPIMIWSEEKLTFEIPSYYHRDKAVDFVSLEGESWSQEMTWDHRVVGEVDSTGYKVYQAWNLPKSLRIPKGGLYENDTDSWPLLARQIAAFQADGSLNDSNGVTFHLRKDRKLFRLLDLFPDNTYRVESNGDYTVYISNWKYGHLKYAGPWLLNWSSEMLDAWLDELPHWDGYFGTTGRVEVMGVNKQHIEWVATIAHLRGKAASLSVRTNRPEDRQDLWTTGVNNRTKARVSSMLITRYEKPATDVYCPKTSSGFFLFRRNGKIGVTGNTNYGGGARTMAIAAGVTVAQAERFQRIYFGANPGIKAWHHRVEEQLKSRRYVENAFGYRRYYFDRVDGLLPEALAWIPQSTVANVINRAWLNIHNNLKEVKVLLQVHDSLCGEFPTHKKEWCLRRMKEESQIVVPYDDPLIIPVGINCSEKSWGHCK